MSCLGRPLQLTCMSGRWAQALMVAVCSTWYAPRALSSRSVMVVGTMAVERRVLLETSRGARPFLGLVEHTGLLAGTCLLLHVCGTCTPEKLL